MTRSGKIDHLGALTEFKLLPVHERYTHALPRNTKYLTIAARSSFTDGFLPILLNHGDAFLGPEGINKTAWDTKLLLIAVFIYLVDCISSCHILKGQHCCLRLNECFNLPLVPHLLPSCHPIHSIFDITGTEKII